MPQITLNIATIQPPRASAPKYGSVKTAEGKYYSYPIEKMTFQPNSTVTVMYDEKPGSNGKVFYNITDVLPDRPDVPPPAGNRNSQHYDLKDRIITRIAIAKSCIEAGGYALADAQQWLDWVEGRTKVEPVRPPQGIPPGSGRQRQSQPTHPDPDEYNQDDGYNDDVPF